jgi:hypothetical protein
MIEQDWMISAHYALNAVYWFLFYMVYPRDATKVKVLAVK